MFDTAVFLERCPWITDLENATELLIAWATEGRTRLVQTQTKLDLEGHVADIMDALEDNVDRITNTTEEQLRPIRDALTTKASASRGKTGELLYETWTKSIASSWQTECTSRVPHCGDYIHTHFDSKKRVITDVKNYTRDVPTSEIEKLWRDMEEQRIPLGMIVSLTTSICGHRNGLDIEVRTIHGKRYCMMFVSNVMEKKEMLSVAIEMLRLYDTGTECKSIDTEPLKEMLATISDLEETARKFEKDMTQTVTRYRQQIQCQYSLLQQTIRILLPDS